MLKLAELLQQVAACEGGVEKNRLALNLQASYGSRLAFNVLAAHSDSELVTVYDVATFLNDYFVSFRMLHLFAIFAEYAPIRNVLTYEDYLLLTCSRRYNSKDSSSLPTDPSSITDELRYKLETSLVLFLMKELKYQRLLEEKRLELFQGAKGERYDMEELFRMITEEKNITYEALKRFMEKQELEFNHADWESLVFRTKKLVVVNGSKTVITFTEFHDLLYPITYFQLISRQEYNHWISYLDQEERPTALNVHNDADCLIPPTPPNDHLLLTTPSKSLSSTSFTPLKHLSLASTTTPKKKSHSKPQVKRLELSFFDSFYKIDDDMGNNAPTKNNKDKDNVIRSTSVNDTEQQQQEKEAWLDYRKRYMNMKMLSKYERYMMCYRQALDDMYA